MTTIVIIGSGIVGCSIAQEISNENIDLHVIEKNHSFGEGITSRNSGVIHAGLYYPPHSLKSKLCQEGRELLYHWCAQKSIPHRKTGKLIISAKTQDEIWLDALYQNAIKNGLKTSELTVLSQSEIIKWSPHIQGTKAIYSFQSGIVDVHSFCQSLYVEAVKKGALFHFDCEVKEIDHMENYIVNTTRGPIEADVVINSSGLYADAVAKLVGVHQYTIYPWRGDYFKLELPYEISSLIYPVYQPGSSGLGIHLTMNMDGKYFLGPDSEPSDSKEDFSDRTEKLPQFYEAASQYLSDLRPEMLTYETCGIRPKLRSYSDKEEKDFVISEDLPGFFNLVGIESPGITAALAISRYIKDKILKFCSMVV